MDLLKVILLEDDPVDAELLQRLLNKDHRGGPTCPFPGFNFTRLIYRSDQ
ncbi:hypothetical protein [Foetidibacter luteolus]|nr:hypothetical protein [Foetidibacter luteolus]